MKERVSETVKKNLKESRLTRKEMIVKGGKYAAFTAAATMMVLNPSKVYAADSAPAIPPGW